jgi:hypothetical protein
MPRWPHARVHLAGLSLLALTACGGAPSEPLDTSDAAALGDAAAAAGSSDVGTQPPTATEPESAPDVAPDAEPAAEPAQAAAPAPVEPAAPPPAAAPPAANAAAPPPGAPPPGAPPAAAPAAPAKPGAGVALPPAGTFTYAQQGEERFSFAGAPETRRALPSRMTITVSGSGASRGLNVAYSDQRSDQVQVREEAGQVLLVRDVIRVDAGGAEQSTDFQPTPAIPLLPSREPGHAFTGQFKASMSGTYAGKVLRQESIRVGTKEVPCLVVLLDLRFTSGELIGTNSTTTWWDLETGRLVQQDLKIDVDRDGVKYKQSSRLTLQG